MSRRIWAITAVFAVLTTALVPGLAQTDHAQALVEAAETDLQRGQTPAAVEKLKSAIHESPNWFVAYSRLGVAYQMSDMEQAAQQQYLRIQRMADTVEGPVTGPGSTELGRQLIRECEAYMTLLVNRTRMRRGKTMLFPHPKISVVARAHSREMRDRDYFSHTSPVEGRRTVADRFVNMFGFQPRCVAENLVRRWRSGKGISLSMANIAESQSDLLDSPGHRANLLRDEVSHIGVGIAINNEGDYWVTQVFADLRTHSGH